MILWYHPWSESKDHIHQYWKLDVGAYLWLKLQSKNIVCNICISSQSLFIQKEDHFLFHIYYLPCLWRNSLKRRSLIYLFKGEQWNSKAADWHPKILVYHFTYQCKWPRFNTVDRLGCPLSLDYYLSLPEQQLEGVGLSAGLEAILGSGQQQQGPRPRTSNNRSYGWCVMRRLEVPPQHKVEVTI